MSPINRLPENLDSFTGRPLDSFDEKNFRRQLLAAVRSLEARKQAGAPAPEFGTVVRTFHILVPRNDAAKEFITDVVNGSGYIPADPFNKIIELATYAARNGWVQFCNELINRRRVGDKWNPTIQEMINEQLKKLNDEH